MQKIIEILIPLILIVVLLMCMMNDDNDGFSVGGQCKAGNGPPTAPIPSAPIPSGNRPSANGNGNRPSGNGNSNTCNVTMVWADWCGFSKKAKPEWDNLVKEMNNKNINGYNLQFKDAEEKIDPETVKKHGTKGFPTYYVELSDKPGQKEEFNSIKKDDMLKKIKEAIAKMSGSSGQGAKPQNTRVQPPIAGKMCEGCGKSKEDCKCNKGGKMCESCRKSKEDCDCNKPNPSIGINALIQQANKPTGGPSRFADSYNSIRPTVYGEILFSSCNDEYGPLRLDSVDRNLAGVGNPGQAVVGKGDCTSLEFAPVKSALGDSQLPSSGASIPSLAQLKTPGIDAVNGIIRPSSFGTPVAHGGDSGGNATVTMVWADWCGYSKKAKPEWDKLVGEVNNTEMDGCKVQLRDLEQKKDEAEIKKDYSDVNGFPTYVVEVTDQSGKLLHKGDFNSIKKDDMLQKIKAEIAKA